MLPRDASVDELIDRLNAASFDAIGEINEAVDGTKSISEQHLASVQLMALLNGYMQDLTEALRASLEQLEKSAKRVPHEIDLLKNDVRRFDERQAEKLPVISDLVNQSRRSAVLNQLTTLNEVRTRVESVRELLTASLSPQDQPEQVRKQLAEVFANTPDESKWASSGQNYYGLFNKMLNQ